MQLTSPDYYGSAMRGFENGRKMRVQLETQRALAALQGGDPKAMQQLYTWNPEMAMRVEDQMRQRAEWERGDESRSAMSAVLLGGGEAPQGNPLAASSQAQPSATVPAPQRDPLAPLPDAASTVANPAMPNATAPMQQPQRPRYSPDEERLIRNDPDAFLTFQGKRLEVTKREFDNIRNLHNMAMQLVGGVHDQASYDSAKQQAANLYSSFGRDASEFIAALPQVYSPETIKMLQLQGMDTSKQLVAVARENRLEWDIEDDKADNAALAEHRSGQRANVRRGQDRRGGGRGGSKAPTPTTVIGAIMDKQRKGQPLSAAERQTLEEYRAGRGGKGKQPRSDLVGQVYQRDGRRIQYSKSKGGYVDLATGQKVN